MPGLKSSLRILVSAVDQLAVRRAAEVDAVGVVVDAAPVVFC
jgi:hypothetical protein